MSKKTFTVIGYYDDNKQPWAHSALAEDPQEAARIAAREMVNSGAHPSDVGVVDVIEGDVNCVLGNEEIQWASDLLDEEKAEGS